MDKQDNFCKCDCHKDSAMCNWCLEDHIEYCKNHPHKVKWDYSSIYTEEDALWVEGECINCLEGFQETFISNGYSKLNDEQEWENFNEHLEIVK